jgi:hypothetical protein
VQFELPSAEHGADVMFASSRASVRDKFRVRVRVRVGANLLENTLYVIVSLIVSFTIVSFILVYVSCENWVSFSFFKADTIMTVILSWLLY